MVVKHGVSLQKKKTNLRRLGRKILRKKYGTVRELDGTLKSGRNLEVNESVEHVDRVRIQKIKELDGWHTPNVTLKKRQKAPKRKPCDNRGGGRPWKRWKVWKAT